MSPGSRTCRVCEVSKPIEEFPFQSDKRWRRHDCKSCSQQYRREWRQKNRERYLAGCRAYDKKNRERIAAQRRANPRYGFCQCALGAKTRGIEFRLSFFEYLELRGKPCVYCGQDVIGGGIDRLDNEKGYVPGNVVPCCTLCNRMKLTLPLAVFLEHVRRICRQQGLNLDAPDVPDHTRSTEAVRLLGSPGSLRRIDA